MCSLCCMANLQKQKEEPAAEDNWLTMRKLFECAPTLIQEMIGSSVFVTSSQVAVEQKLSKRLAFSLLELLTD